VLASVEAPNWAHLTQNWRDGHVKLAWTRHLLKLRAELAGVLADGDYQPLAVSGPYRDHVIAFARRRGRDAVIVAVAKSLAAFSQGGRAWPLAEAFDGTLSLDGYSVEGVNGAELRLSSLFRHLPVAALRARFEGALRPARMRLHA
jgi:(1->4)-alpha-D-glucan 1-alpha-D-glucosylmutase